MQACGDRLIERDPVHRASRRVFWDRRNRRHRPGRFSTISPRSGARKAAGRVGRKNGLPGSRGAHHDLALSRYCKAWVERRARRPVDANRDTAGDMPSWSMCRRAQRIHHRASMPCSRASPIHADRAPSHTRKMFDPALTTALEAELRHLLHLSHQRTRVARLMRGIGAHQGLARQFEQDAL